MSDNTKEKNEASCCGCNCSSTTAASLLRHIADFFDKDKSEKK